MCKNIAICAAAVPLPLILVILELLKVIEPSKNILRAQVCKHAGVTVGADNGYLIPLFFSTCYCSTHYAKLF